MAGNFINLDDTILHGVRADHHIAGPTTATTSTGIQRNMISMTLPAGTETAYANATMRWGGKTLSAGTNQSYGVPVRFDSGASGGGFAVAYEMHAMIYENQGTDRVLAHFLAMVGPNTGTSVSGVSAQWKDLPPTAISQTGIHQLHMAAKGIVAMDPSRTSSPDSAIWVGVSFVNAEPDDQAVQVYFSVTARVVGTGRGIWSPYQ